MGKLAIWILVALAVLLLYRQFGSAKRRLRRDAEAEAPRNAAGRRGDDRADGTEPGRPAGELIMACAVCGLHLPASDAVFARGKVYCGDEHRDQDRAGGSGA